MLSIGKEFHFIHSENESKVPTEDVEQRAKQLIQQANLTSQKTAQCADGALRPIKKRALENSSESADWQDKAQEILTQLDAVFKAIDFDPQYEKQVVRTISVDEAKPLIDALLKLQKFHGGLKHLSRQTETQFWLLVKPWMDKFAFTIRFAALQSRNLQLAALKHDPTRSEDYELDVVIIQEHIDRLLNTARYPKYYFEVLMNLLNLKRLSGRDREPTMDEQQAFRFLCEIGRKIGAAS